MLYFINTYMWLWFILAVLFAVCEHSLKRLILLDGVGLVVAQSESERQRWQRRIKSGQRICIAIYSIEMISACLLFTAFVIRLVVKWRGL
jgi:hypothetical protein